MARQTKQLTVGRRRIPVSNLEKILYPGTKFTKARVIDYYISVSKYLLPHLKDRPVTLKRFPEGVFGEAFYEKDAPAFAPSWVKTVAVPRRETPGLTFVTSSSTICQRLFGSQTSRRSRYIRSFIERGDWIVRLRSSSTAIPVKDLTCWFAHAWR